MKSITFRLGEKDYKNFQKDLEQSQMNQSDYVRLALKTNVIYPQATLKELVYQLSKIGTNLNQTQASINNLQKYKPNADITDDIKEISKTMQEVNQICQSLKSYLPQHARNVK